jgi:hypothetical protein
MSERVTDEMVVHALSWARNYGDVEKWRKIKRPKGERGPKWVVILALSKTVSADGTGPITAQTLEETPALLLPRSADIIPRELALTNREVILFCYGLAAGGEREEPRSAYRAYWDRSEVHPSEKARRQRADQRIRDSIGDTKEKEVNSGQES